MISRATRDRFIFIGAFVGCIAAFFIVLGWLPGSLWDNPIAADDAAGHYYMARKLYDNGWSSLLSLSVDDSFYPPLFSAMTVIVMKLGASITAATAVAWLIGAGVFFPFAMAALASWICRKQAHRVRVLVATGTPILASLIPGHPYTQLATGPLLAYGLAQSLLPALLLAFLVLLHTVTGLLDKTGKPSSLIWPVAAVILLGCAEMAAQPRIVFAFIVVVFPFVVQWLIRLGTAHLKFLLAVVVSTVVLGLVAVIVVVRQAAAMHPGESIDNPGGWFELYKPNHTILTGIAFSLTGGCVGCDDSGLVSATILAAVVVVLAVLCFRASWTRGLASSWLLAGFLVYICASVPGPLGNLLTAVWYREEHRIVSMVVVPLILVAVCGMAELARVATASRGRRVLAALLPLVFLASLLANPQRMTLSQVVRDKSAPAQAEPASMVTQYKLDAFSQMGTVVPQQGLVFADPYTGFGYAYGMDDIAAFYPVGNLWPTRERRMVEADFGSGDPDRMTNRLCTVMPGYGDRFVADFGAPYRDDYDHFKYYASFRDRGLIASYVAHDALTLVGEYPSGQDHPFALYQVMCGARIHR